VAEPCVAALVAVLVGVRVVVLVGVAVLERVLVLVVVILVPSGYQARVSDAQTTPEASESSYWVTRSCEPR
jgi:hypothetical protein